MPPPNAADRKSIRRLEKAAKLADAQRHQVIFNLMSTSYGRQWVWDLLAAAHMFEANTISDPRLSGIFDGERNLGLRLLSDIMAACPDQFVQAMREANDRSSTDERRSGSESDGRDFGPSDADSAVDAPGGHDYHPLADLDA
jgi:hypothetical protein